MKMSLIIFALIFSARSFSSISSLLEATQTIVNNCVYTVTDTSSGETLISEKFNDVDSFLVSGKERKIVFSNILVDETIGVVLIVEEGKNYEGEPYNVILEINKAWTRPVIAQAIFVNINDIKLTTSLESRGENYRLKVDCSSKKIILDSVLTPSL